MEPRLNDSIRKKHITKEMMMGFIVGLIATAIGLFICVFIVSLIKGMSISETYIHYFENGTLWTILTLGALPNLAAFFGFLKIDKEYRARGVLLATFIVAIASYIIYFR